jgi:nicotinate-nucleotide--dimethylbenzimidazole phosphoribosyltransferase
MVARIQGGDERAADEVRARLDAKTKPRGSLGRLEELACRLAFAQGGPPRVDATIVVAAADHGVAEEGVSAYPQEVTRQMLVNFERGGAAINVLGRLARTDVRFVDCGVGAATGNIAEGPAMTPAVATAQMRAGVELADACAASGKTVIAVGEMGIANTTAASALAAALLPARTEDVCGRGTGLDDEGVARKRDVVRRALTVNASALADPLDALAGVGGHEIAFLVGVLLGGAATRTAILLDGFITGAAALVAARIAPRASDAMVAAHVSPEPGHALVLAELGLEPLLDLRLRLGEGTGAALALPLLRAATAVVEEMATFEAAGVTDAGR